ncbi:MAG: energy transducer TonB [Bacteroidetes bacterium]|nr:MAG: energy transducer TonB [Bacteroidota bacterium]
MNTQSNRPGDRAPGTGPSAPSTRPHALVPHKNPRVDIKRSYRLTFEIGMVLALLTMIGLIRAPLKDTSEFEVVLAEQEIVEIEEIQQTRQEIKPPPPPRPRVLQVVSDDVILDDIELDLDAGFDMNEAPEYLPPPPPAPPSDEPVEEEEEAEIFVAVEEMPELIGGLASVQECIRYPEIARKAGVEGRVIVQFVVNQDGRVTDPIVLKGIGAGADEEAVRCVLQARFKPGKQRGKPVRVKFSIPITFKLRDAGTQ